MKPLRLINNASNLIILANPEQRSTTFSVDQTVSPKKAGARTVLNSKTVFTSRQIQALPSIPGCTEQCTSDTEVILIKSSISGSVENQLAVNKAVEDHLYNLAIAYPDALLGFLKRDGAYAVNTSVTE